MRRRGDLPVLRGKMDTRSLRAVAPRLRAVREGVVHALASVAAAASGWAKERHVSLSLVRVRAVIMLLVVCLAVLPISASSSASSSPSAPDPTLSDPPLTQAAPTATLYPTPTATPLLPPPQNAPAGWQVYRGHHFAVAYPPGWMPVERVVRGSDGTVSEVSVSFNSEDGHYAVGIAEREGLDAATLQQYCAAPGMHTTFAGLPMIVSTSAGTLRMYVFVSAGGVAYTLLAQASENSPDIAFLDGTILGTFRPEMMASACG